MASYLSSLPAHRAAKAAVESTLEEEGGFWLPVHALLETYSVLTRLPPPHRLAPRLARELLSETCSAVARVAGVEGGDDLWTWLDEIARRGIAGGRIYDAAIARSLLLAGACRLLTLNPRHFTALLPVGFEIVDPTGTADEVAEPALLRGPAMRPPAGRGRWRGASGRGGGRSRR